MTPPPEDVVPRETAPDGPTPPAWTSRARWLVPFTGLTRTDVVLGAAGLFFGAQSLLYPFGRDQATHGYIGREWLAGRLPYVTTFDIKTPGIFFVHMLAFFLFGDHMWGLRVLDLFLAVLPTGVLAAYGATPRGRRPAPGLVGLGVLAANLLYYGPFDFWSTAQCESFCSVFSLAAMVFALRARAETAARDGLLVGFFASVAVSFKPPCFWNAMAVFAVFAGRLLLASPEVAARSLGARERARTLLRAGLGALVGGLVPGAIILGYFGAKGAIPAMVDVLVVTGRDYVVGWRRVDGFGQGFQAVCWGVFNFGATMLVCLNGLVLGAVLARRRGEPALALRHVACLAGLLGGIVTVVVQLKFFAYHWTALVGFLVLSVTSLASDAEERLRARGVPLAALRMRFGAALLVLAYVSAPGELSRSVLLAKRALYYARTGDDGPLEDTWSLPGFYHWSESRLVGEWIDAHSEPGDLVAVRRFEPQVYFLAHERYPGRYFWSTFLTERRFSARRTSMLREDFAAFKAARPRWVVTPADCHEGVDSPETYESLGYVRRKETGTFVVLERTSALDFGKEDSW